MTDLHAASPLDRYAAVGTAFDHLTDSERLTAEANARQHLDGLLERLERISSQMPPVDVETYLRVAEGLDLLGEDLYLFFEEPDFWGDVMRGAYPHVTEQMEQLHRELDAAALSPTLRAATLEHFANYAEEHNPESYGQTVRLDDGAVVVGVLDDHWMYTFAPMIALLVRQYARVGNDDGRVGVMPMWLVDVLRDHFSVYVQLGGPADGVTDTQLETIAVLWDHYNECSPYCDFSSAVSAAQLLG